MQPFEPGRAQEISHHRRPSTRVPRVADEGVQQDRAGGLDRRRGPRAGQGGVRSVGEASRESSTTGARTPTIRRGQPESATRELQPYVCQRLWRLEGIVHTFPYAHFIARNRRRGHQISVHGFSCRRVKAKSPRPSPTMPVSMSMPCDECPPPCARAVERVCLQAWRTCGDRRLRLAGARAVLAAKGRLRGHPHRALCPSRHLNTLFLSPSCR